VRGTPIGLEDVSPELNNEFPSGSSDTRNQGIIGNACFLVRERPPTSESYHIVIYGERTSTPYFHPIADFDASNGHLFVPWKPVKPSPAKYGVASSSTF
jgi:hypothetical protein